MTAPMVASGKPRRKTSAQLLARAATSGITLKEIPARLATAVGEGRTAEARPALFVVVREGRRVDAFHSWPRALATIAALLAEGAP